LLNPNYAKAYGNAVTEAPRETRDLKIFYEFVISFLSGGVILLLISEYTSLTPQSMTATCKSPEELTWNGALVDTNQE